MTPAKDETELTEDDVRSEHHRSAKPAAHWLYLFAVLGGGLVLMVAFIALIGASG